MRPIREMKMGGNWPAKETNCRFMTVCELKSCSEVTMPSKLAALGF